MSPLLPRAIALIAAVAAVAPALAAAPVVSGVAYAPKPFYDDLSSIRVTFRTAAPVAPGWSYYVVVSVSPKRSVSLTECSIVEASKSRIVGGADKLIRVRLYPSQVLGGAFCPGPAEIIVGRWRWPSTDDGVRLRKLEFRVFRAP